MADLTLSLTLPEARALRKRTLNKGQITQEDHERLRRLGQRVDMLIADAEGEGAT